MQTAKNNAPPLSLIIDNEVKSHPLKTQLDSLRIKASEHFEKPKSAWGIINANDDNIATLGTLGNFSLVIGKAKSRKSFFIGVGVSAAISKQPILERIISELPADKDEVLYFDTEQSKYHVWQSVKRICLQSKVNEPENLYVYGLRSKTPAERLELVEYAIYDNDKVGFVVIDGIKDLITSINDEGEATMISSKLLRWTEERNIHIVCVLHQNKGNDSARGHIGSELINKAETVLSITKSETDSTISIVEAQQCRNIEPDKLAFEINENGIPVIAADYESRTQTRAARQDPSDLEDYKLYQILNEVFTHGNSFMYSKLIEQVKIAYKNQIGTPIGDNKTKSMITLCRNKSWLIQPDSGKNYILGEYIKPAGAV